jgi:hypothetical protein
VEWGCRESFQEWLRLYLIQKYGPKSETLNDAQLLLELEPVVSSAEVEAESSARPLCDSGWRPVARPPTLGSPRYRFFLPVKVLSRVFRGKFVDGLKRAFRKGELCFPGGLKPLAQEKAFRAFLRPLFRQDWVASGFYSTVAIRQSQQSTLRRPALPPDTTHRRVIR